jgi:hypothetical protein
VIDLAVYLDTDARNTPIIETNGGVRLSSPDWPHDSDSRLVAFDPSSPTCWVVDSESLAEDISEALAAIDKSGVLNSGRPGWYFRLADCARGVHRNVGDRRFSL